MLNGLIGILGAAINVFWGGFVIARLWAWFVMPLGAPFIGVLHAAGLVLLFQLAMGTRGIELRILLGEITPKQRSQMVVVQAILAAVAPAIGLLMGWLIHMGM